MLCREDTVDAVGHGCNRSRAMGHIKLLFEVHTIRVNIAPTPHTLEMGHIRTNAHRYRGSLKRSARAVQLFGRLAVLETHTLRY